MGMRVLELLVVHTIGLEKVTVVTQCDSGACDWGMDWGGVKVFTGVTGMLGWRRDRDVRVEA